MGFADFGEVEVNEGGLEGAMTEVSRDLSDVDSGFQKVGGVAVAQGVDDELGMFLGEAALHFGEFPDLPGRAVTHGFATVVEGLLEGDPGGFPTASGGGKDPVGVAVPGPEAAQPGEEFGGDGDEAFVATFGMP